MKTIIVLALGLLFINAVYGKEISNSHSNDGDKWKVLGTKQIGFKADYDVIVLGAGNDKVSKIKFKVAESPVDMIKIQITYDVGSEDNIELRGLIPKDGESRTVDIRGVGKKKIRKITFWYNTKGFNGNATVTILGVD